MKILFLIQLRLRLVFVKVGVFISLIAYAFPALAECDRPLTIGYEHYPPFLIVKDGELIGGVDLKIVDALAKYTGCEIIWLARPWKRHLIGIENGYIDMASSTFLTTERVQFALFSIPYRHAEKTLFINQDVEPPQSVEQFLEQGNKLSLVRGYDYSQMSNIVNLLNSENIEYASESVINLRKLAKGRVEGTVEERLVFNHLANTAGLSNRIRDTGIVLQADPMHFMFSKTSVNIETITLFNNAIKALQDNNTLDSILKQYHIN
ncbi:substrate-binding periplasmic protein [Kiloniella sp.]|uniref:substrate-binding periplasmic protein n=1 Tax=Kiloniella sp. TaxID=1938587 RepID=UPI003B019D75